MNVILQKVDNQCAVLTQTAPIHLEVTRASVANRKNTTVQAATGKIASVGFGLLSVPDISDHFCSIVTARVAKRAKVMFSQVVCHSVTERGGVGGQHQRSTTSLPGQGQRSQHLPTSQGQRSQHLPPPQPGSKATTPPPPGHYAQAGGTHPTGMHSCMILV